MREVMASGDARHCAAAPRLLFFACYAVQKTPASQPFPSSLQSLQVQP